MYFGDIDCESNCLKRVYCGDGSDGDGERILVFLVIISFLYLNFVVV